MITKAKRRTAWRTAEEPAPKLQAPFPYFGGKSRIAAEVWRRFGAVRNYVEPFFGSGATFLLRPRPFVGIETVNDYDGLIANFWRAVKHDPAAVAHFADWPVNENDLHARHAWLVGQKDSLQATLEGDPDYYDAKIAGWWCWGACCWIGGGWCSGKGPWQVVGRKLVHLGDSGHGVNRKRVHLGDSGHGVNRQRVHLGDNGRGLADWMEALAERLRRVRVCCGDWSRVCGPTPTTQQGLTAVFLDPPYTSKAGRDPGCYRVDSLTVGRDVYRWAREHESDPKLRIAVCGYEGEYKFPKRWECLAWKAHGGYSNRNDGNGNKHRERIWFSPHCLAAVPKEAAA